VDELGKQMQGTGNLPESWLPGACERVAMAEVSSGRTIDSERQQKQVEKAGIDKESHREVVSVFDEDGKGPGISGLHACMRGGGERQ
jgi:hypothetical protein